jgi:hypothetical protein
MPKELSKWRRAAATGKRYGTITGTVVKCFRISRNEPLKTASKRLDEHVSDRASRNMAVALLLNVGGPQIVRVLVQISLGLCLGLASGPLRLYAAKTAAQSSGAVAGFPVSVLRLN